LREYRFTNVWRVLDRVSQFELREVIYKGSQEPEELLFKVMLFKLFNSTVTWQVLTEKLGPLSWKTFKAEDYEKVLDAAVARKVNIWNSAYVQNQSYRPDLVGKHRRYITLLEYIMKTDTLSELLAAKSYEAAFRVLQRLPLHQQNFIPMQHLCDLNYSPLLSFDENDFIMPGGGCLDGLQKCFGIRLVPTNSYDMHTAADILKYCCDKQEEYFAAIDEKPVTLFGRRLSLMDLQNCMCECDKVSRVKHPEYNLKRSKLKRRYDPEVDRELPPTMLPPKWGISIPEPIIEGEAVFDTIILSDEIRKVRRLQRRQKQPMTEDQTCTELFRLEE
jgi:hypothetical protein